MIRNLVIVFSISLLTTAAHAQVSFTPLGTWTPTDISGDGSIVIGYRTPQPWWGVRWTERTGALPFPSEPQPGIEVWPRAISNNGSVIVGSQHFILGAQSRAFRWTPEDGMKHMFDFNSSARAVSADGSVVVGFLTPSEGTSGWYRWTSNSEIISVTLTNPNSVSDDGEVVVGGPYRWTAQEGSFPIPPPTESEGGLYISDLSGDGSSVVGHALYHVEGPLFRPGAIRWTASSGTLELADLEGGMVKSAALGVSADGSMIVGFGTGEGDIEKATIWSDALGVVSLQDFLISNGVDNLDGWNLSQATGISADGRTIIGQGFNPSGEVEAWIATVPEPSSLLLIGIAGLGLLTAVIRHRDRTARHRQTEVAS